MEQIKCDGNCIETHGAHSGKVLAVEVTGQGWQPLQFNYCETARQEDTERGFHVQIITDEPA